MKKYKIHLWIIIFVVFAFLIRVPVTYVRFIKDIPKHVSKTQYTITDGSDTIAAILGYQSRKVFEEGNFENTGSRFFNSIVALFISLEICFVGFVLIINMREKIIQHNTIYFHGSKYKDGASLS